MTAKTFVDTHPLRGAFLANRLDRLADLISGQGEVLLQDLCIEIPPRAVSVFLLIGERGEISAAEIAGLLDQPHQLATQRIDLLIEAGVIERMPDPDDGRRKILKLTAKGRRQHLNVRLRLEDTARVFAALFEEIGCDLNECAERAADALTRRSLMERVATLDE